MARIAGVDLPPNKQIKIGLTYVYGIGRTRAKEILAKANVDKDVKVKDLTEDDARKIREVVQDDMRVEGDLRKEVTQNIKRLIEIGSFSWHAPSQRPAGSGTENAYERAHQKGPAPHGGGRQEEGHHHQVRDVR